MKVYIKSVKIGKENRKEIDFDGVEDYLNYSLRYALHGDKHKMVTVHGSDGDIKIGQAMLVSMLPTYYRKVHFEKYAQKDDGHSETDFNLPTFTCGVILDFIDLLFQKNGLNIFNYSYDLVEIFRLAKYTNNEQLVESIAVWLYELISCDSPHTLNISWCKHFCIINMVGSVAEREKFFTDILLCMVGDVSEKLKKYFLINCRDLVPIKYMIDLIKYTSGHGDTVFLKGILDAVLYKKTFLSGHNGVYGDHLMVLLSVLRKEQGKLTEEHDQRMIADTITELESEKLNINEDLNKVNTDCLG